MEAWWPRKVGSDLGEYGTSRLRLGLIRGDSAASRSSRNSYRPKLTRLGMTLTGCDKGCAGTKVRGSGPSSLQSSESPLKSDVSINSLFSSRGPNPDPTYNPPRKSGEKFRAERTMPRSCCTLVRSGSMLVTVTSSVCPNDLDLGKILMCRVQRIGCASLRPED
jgi:hypothetical protein